ncbi:hypothetical protein EUGRSUZ_I01558 [Eucalyptus grandis]|uniref:Uncharacterized protein n=2 Tax=Eucalyptus grandis TaxID=71139 RepID=A0ACC3JFQ1_EUCGR|nr:hypothetical protein EUGRSUZ_I01558 [Eucalyptus grandis]
MRSIYIISMFLPLEFHYTICHDKLNQINLGTKKRTKSTHLHSRTSACTYIYEHKLVHHSFHIFKTFV